MGITENTTHNFVLTPINSPRLSPPYGPTEGLVGVDYTFCFDLPDEPECEPYFVMWNWGDGTFEEWIGPYASGETVCANHSWGEPGDYEIRVGVKDGCGNESWSDPLIITIYSDIGPELDLIVEGGVLGYTVTVKNVGNETVNGTINITITTDAWFMLTGQEFVHSFTVPDPGVNSSIKLRPVIGFGPATINVSGVYTLTVPSAEGDYYAEAKGFVLLFFVLVSFEPIPIP